MTWRRKKSVVDFRQQIWFALELVVVTMGFVVICGYLIFLPPLNDIMGAGNRAELLLNDLMELILLDWPLVLLGAGVLVTIGMLMSHRLAGPLYGLDRTVHAWRNGDRSARVHFRKYDYLLPAKKGLNDFFDAQELLYKRVESLAREIQQNAAEGATEKTRAKCEELVAILTEKSR